MKPRKSFSKKKQKDFIQQISNLKINKQLLDLENRALKSTSVLKRDTRLDSSIIKGKKTHDKSGLGYKRISPSLISSKNPQSPKKRETNSK